MPDSRPARPTRRPASLIWLCGGLLLVGAIYLGRAIRAAQFAPAYIELGVAFSATIQGIAGLVWGSAFMWAAWRLWHRQTGAPRQTLILVGGCGLFEVLWQRAFARSDYAVDRWPFVVFTAALLVVFVIVLLNRPRVRALFRHEPADTPARESS